MGDSQRDGIPGSKKYRRSMNEATTILTKWREEAQLLNPSTDALRLRATTELLSMAMFELRKNQQFNARQKFTVEVIEAKLIEAAKGEK